MGFAIMLLQTRVPKVDSVIEVLLAVNDKYEYEGYQARPQPQFRW